MRYTVVAVPSWMPAYIVGKTDSLNVAGNMAWGAVVCDMDVIVGKCNERGEKVKAWKFFADRRPVQEVDLLAG